MTRGLFALLLCLLVVPAFSQKIYRSQNKLMSAITLTAAQEKQMAKVDAKYGPPFTALVKKQQAGEDVMDDMDALNRKYSKAILGVMTDKQKLTYLHAVYEHVMDFIDSHPGAKMNDIFIWGGAYAVKPEVKHLPKGYPG